MGNTTSSNTVSRQRTGVDDLASKQGSRSWATMDHTISGPWSFIVKEHVQCMCEGGKSCSGENPARQPTPNAVVGLHSNWVGDNILAMARPWQENILKHDLVNKFIELDVGMILNLQEVGEHDSCGPGNLPNSGFTYSPETFMAARIGFYNLSWRDMGVPTLDKMMDIVQIMHYTTAVEKKKIVVHCHAGLGRTGLAIACYKVACEQMTATQAIDFVRQCRPGSLQTKAQVLFVPIFEQYTQHLRCLFKVADLRQLSLGNENYILTKVSHKLSRSVSARSRSASDSVAAATAALNSISIAGNCGTSVDSHGEVPTAATAADWTAATFEPMTADEAARVPSAAEAAATAALNLSGNGSEDGILVQHARRLSAGGGSMKLVCNLKAITEDADKPVHVLETDSAVTEVYNSGLTIIRSAQSAKKLQALAPRATTEQLVLERMLTTTDLGLDCQKPWNEKFHVKPEAYVAEGWLPEAPSSYVEALRRQQRLLHGMERRQSLRLHKLPKAAAKALFNAGRAYNEVMEHLDIPPAIDASSSTSGILKRTHSRSRSSAAAELLALTAGLSSSSSGGGSLPMSPSKGHLGSLSASSTSSGCCASPGSSSLGGAAQSLLPAGINFGAPGCSRGNSTSGHQRGNKSCLAGCCAPSFAAGLLAALLYKGRYPEEYKVQWSLCPRLTALGFAEGPIICSQLQSIKLALNAGKYEMLETASAAVAIVVLGDWFESFVSEALTEKTLELMVDEADQLLAETLEVIETRRSLLQRLTDSAANPRQHPQHRSKTTLGVVTEQEDSEALAHKATARAVCCEMLAHEQELCLLLAAMMRHVRLASIEDSRLQSWMNSSEFEKAVESGSRANKPQLSSQSLHLSALSAQQQAIEEEVDAAMDALYKICASWLLGPLAVACSTALEAVQKFLNFLTLDDDAYSYLLQATREQGIKKSHSQPSQNSIDSLDSLYSSSTAPTTPRSRLRDRLANITLHKSAGHGSPRSGSCPGTLNSTARGTTSRSKLGETASSPPQKHSSQPSMKIGAFSPKGSHLGPGLMQNSTRSLEGLRMSPSAGRLPQPEQQGNDRSIMQWPGFSEVEDCALVPRYGIQLAQEERCSPGGERQPERVDTVNTAGPGLSSLAAELGDKGSQPDLGLSGVPTGLLPVPPRSSSPVPPSGSRSSTGARQIQLPAMRASGASAALAAGVGLQGNIASTAADAAGGQQSAHTKLTAQQQQHPSPANDNCINSSTLPAAASVPASAGVSTVPSSVDVGANQMLSASMLSDIQLPSFASTCSVAESLLAQSRQSMDVSSLRG